MMDLQAVLEKLRQPSVKQPFKLVVTREQFKLFTEAGVPADELIIGDFLTSSYEDEPLRTVEFTKGPRNRWGGVK